MKAREDVPSQTYSFFMELLMDTVRDEVASCIEESFQTVKRDDARVLLGLNEGSESVFEEFVVRALAPCCADVRVFFCSCSRSPSCLFSDE